MQIRTQNIYPSTWVNIFHELFRREPIFSSVALFLVMLMVPTGLAMMMESRTFLDQNVWIKPLKFEFALALYLGTLAWFAGWLPNGTTKKRGYQVYSWLVVFCILGEVVWVSGAAMYGTASHFNVSIPFMARLYAVMGVFAVTLTSVALFFSIKIARNPDNTLNFAFKLSVVSGLAITFISTVIVAGYLSSNGGHFVGNVVSSANGFPVMGWSREVGDLRVAHFLATHALHAIPIVGYLVSGMAYARFWVVVFSLAYTGLINYTFTQALDGRAFLVF